MMKVYYSVFGRFIVRRSKHRISEKTYFLPFNGSKTNDYIVKAHYRSCENR
jgi:hypothetical protein